MVQRFVFLVIIGYLGHDKAQLYPLLQMANLMRWFLV